MSEPLRARRLVLAGLACAPLATLVRKARASSVRALSFYHTHTDERLTVTYFSEGGYVPDAIASIEYFLRDFRSGEMHTIDLTLLDTLHLLTTVCGTATYEVISGYRSPATNAQLQAASEGVATNSLHVEGRAVDVRLTGVDTGRLRDAGLDLARGGVGYYPRSNFVHLDTGRVRSWAAPG